MPTDSQERQHWRRAYVDSFLADFGLAFEMLAPSTQSHLMEWARQAKLVEDQPSSNFQTVVLQLCKAVESELAAGLGSLRRLSFLKRGALGQKAAEMKKAQLDENAKRRIHSWDMSPALVLSEVPALLSSLAKLRRDTDAAHGNAETRSATLDEASQARALAGRILRSIRRRKLR